MTLVAVKSLLTELSDEATGYPSFLHRDLAYLLALEVKDTGTLSAVWQARVERWKRLVCWWLLAEVEEESFPILPPLLDHVPRDRAGVPVADSITWLTRRSPDGPSVPLGTLSPFVLVRPTPDHEDDPRVWGNTAAPWLDGRWPGLLSDLLAVTAQARDHAPSGSSAAVALSRLLGLLEHHFERGSRSLVECGRRARSVVIRHPRSLDGFALSVNRASATEGHRVAPPPACAACGTILLPATVDAVPAQDALCLPCPRCATLATVSLADLHLVWRRPTDASPSTLGVWTERALYWADLPGGQPPASPPVPRIEAQAVVFEYPRTIPSVALREEAASRQLVVRAPAIQPLSIDTVTFAQPIWPGAARLAEGVLVSPLRPEYLDLAAGPASALEPTAGAGRGLRLPLKGLPASVRFMPSGALAPFPQAGLALWPDPRQVGPEWKWFRLATDASLRLEAPASRPLRPAVRDSTSGLPPHAAVRTPDRDCGATFLFDRDLLAPRGRGTVEVELGVDFGTTNSLVYSAERGTSFPSDRAFEPHHLREAAFLACRPVDAPAFFDGILPRAGAADPAIVPSELCEHGLVHWAEKACCAAERVRYMFKGDPHADEVRRTYLDELLKHALLDVVSRREGPVGRLDVTAVFTHPLSLTAEQRRQFEGTVRAVRASLAEQGILSAASEAFLLDESTAGILSVGQPHAADVLLAADLGGGTLDVSLGRGTRDERDQIGSLDCGGHFFLSALCSHSVEDVREVQRSIRSRPDEVRARLSKPGSARLLERYTGHLLFFLETMVASFVTRRPLEASAGPLEVKLHLLGNGWGFLRLLARTDDDPNHVWEEGIRGLVRRMEQDLEEVLGQPLRLTWARGERPPKHAVAHGALKLAGAGGASARPAAAMALPAGVSFEVTGPHGFRLEWHDLFGPATDRNPSLRDRQLDDTVRFEFDELEGHLERARVLAGQIPPAREHDGILRQRLLTAQNRCGGVAPTGYLRGPLQLLLEHWTGRLSP